MGLRVRYYCISCKLDGEDFPESNSRADIREHIREEHPNVADTKRAFKRNIGRQTEVADD